MPPISRPQNGAEADKDSSLEQYLSDKSGLIRGVHRALRYLTLALALACLALFAWAVYLAVVAGDPLGDPRVGFWAFIWLASDGLLLVVFGLQAMLLQVSPAALLPGYQGEVQAPARARKRAGSRSGWPIFGVGFMMLATFSGLAVCGRQTGQNLLVPAIIALVVLSSVAGLVAVLIGALRRQSVR